MRRLITIAGFVAAALSALVGTPALAQSTCPYIAYGAVLTAAQWNQCFALKSDYISGGYLPFSGGTLIGPLITAPSGTVAAGFNIPPGTAPTSPNNGDLWVTSGGVFGEVNGVTVTLAASATGGANPTATAGPAAINGTATTFIRSDAAPAIQKATAAQFGIVEVDNTTITASGGVITVAAVPASGLTGSTLAASVTASSLTSVGTLASLTVGGAATFTGLSTGTQVSCLGLSSGNAVVLATGACGSGGGGTPGGSTTQVQYNNAGSFGGITGATTNGTALTLVAPVLGTPASGTLTNATGLPISTGVSGLGTGVATAAAISLSGAGGLTSTIASGTSAMGTGAISSASCATVVTTAATNTATTDVVTASFNGDPTAVTGYVPLTAGMLTIIAYPTANNVNFKVCNNSSGSITPGAITLNWRVAR